MPRFFNLKLEYLSSELAEPRCSQALPIKVKLLSVKVDRRCMASTNYMF